MRLAEELSPGTTGHIKVLGITDEQYRQINEFSLNRASRRQRLEMRRWWNRMTIGRAGRTVWDIRPLSVQRGTRTTNQSMEAKDRKVREGW